TTANWKRVTHALLTVRHSLRLLSTVPISSAAASHGFTGRGKSARQNGYEDPLMMHLNKCVVAIASVAVVAYLTTGMRYASYSPQRSNNYLWAVYHVHSSMSDGLQS